MQKKPHPVDVHVGLRVRELRLKRSISQSGLAKAIRVSFQQVQKYERGDNRISASKLFHIAQFLGESVSYFFKELEVKEPLEPETLTMQEETLALLQSYYEIKHTKTRRLLLDITQLLSVDE